VGTLGGGAENAFFVAPFYSGIKYHHLAKAGSGQTQEKLRKMMALSVGG
jgi:hypothetical protein